MLDHKRIEALAKIGNKEHFITSLYLNIDRAQHRSDYKLNLKDLLKAKRNQHDDHKPSFTHRQKDALDKDMDKIEHYVNKEFIHKDISKGLAVFTCGPLNLWETIELPQPVHDYLSCDFDTYIRPLSDLVSQYRRYMIILVDSKKAKIFDVTLGFANPYMTFDDDVQPKIKFGGQDGVKERNIDRAHEEMVMKHFRHVVHESKTLFDSKPFNWIILGGRQQLIRHFQPLMPFDMHKKLIGHIVAEPDAPLPEVLRKSDEIARLALEKLELDLIARLKSETHTKSGKGIFGLQPTLHSLRRGGVDTLIVTRNFQSPGIKCKTCNFLGTNEEKDYSNRCPVCSAAIIPVRDILEDAVTYAYKTGCKIENIAENSRFKMMGNVGAILRF